MPAESSITGLLARARRHLDQGRPDDALAVLEGTRERLARHPEYRALLATVYGELGRFREAAEHARAVTEIAPRVPEYQYLASMAYYHAGYLTMAHRARRSFLAARPSELAGTQELLALEQEYLLAMQALQTMYGVRDAKTVEEAGYELDQGRWALHQGQRADALKHLRRSTSLLRRWPPPRNNASMVLYLMGRPDEAVREA